MACGCDQVKHVVQGAAKLVQSAAGLGLADEATIEQYRVIRQACQHAVPCQAIRQLYDIEKQAKERDAEDALAHAN
ncbi:hypothetical protein ACERK3_18515 [Phycisphaerales bacterium AB-hyl4]|uniref:Uncharacterized protein n=1 Tax=Natronomicrosphaera hydrolytica TaxID=3242702 RepID=A0ABV4U9J9_9BACT